MQDCMGGELYNKLVNNVKPIKLTFHSDKNSQYDHNSHSIILKSCNSDTLLHEMFHAYQHSVLEKDKYDKANVNYEIEAQIARYNFLLRRSDVEGLSNHNDFVSTNFGVAISRTANCYTSKSIPITSKLPKLESNYTLAIKYVLEKGKEINMDMTFNTAFSPKKNVQNIIDLSKNC